MMNFKGMQCIQCTVHYTRKYLLSSNLIAAKEDRRSRRILEVRRHLRIQRANLKSKKFLMFAVYRLTTADGVDVSTRSFKTLLQFPNFNGIHLYGFM